MKTLRVDVWSDIACPWCHVGKRRLEAALAGFAHRDSVKVVWRAFELDPAAPPARDVPAAYASRLARKYGTGVAQAQAMIERMTSVAAADGLDFRFDRIRPGTMFDAHRLLHLAGERGCQDALKERLLRAYLTEGAAFGEPGVLVRLATEGGLDPDEAQALLSSDTYASDVRRDEAEAASLGIQGVPFFRFGERLGVSGAQPVSVLVAALERAWTAHQPLEVFADGSACGPDGCA